MAEKEPGEPRELSPEEIEDVKDMHNTEEAEYLRACHLLSEKDLKNRIETLKEQLNLAEQELGFRERNEK